MKVLFVCLGNICRSPAAEGVFCSLLEKSDLSSRVEVDSAGTSGHHVGEPADARMRNHALERGYKLTSLSRRFDPFRDFEYFDKILVMDQSNLESLIELDIDKRYRDKLILMTDYCYQNKRDHVPDPYYGGAQGFETVLDILEDACGGLLKEVKTLL